MLASTEAAMPIPEDQLTARCREGDMEAFAQLYALYQQTVFQHAYYLLDNREEAQDVCQETFLRACRALPNFRGGCSLKTWLLKICGNLCRDYLRAPRRQREIGYDPRQAEELLNAASPALDPAAAVERAEMARTIQIALHALPLSAREIIILRDVEDLTFDEIAVIVGCVRLSVPVKLFRARRLLKARVKMLLDEGV